MFTCSRCDEDFKSLYNAMSHEKNCRKASKLNKLNKDQAKMVIEYFSQQAAQEAPVKTTDWSEWDRFIWMSNYKASLAIERIIGDGDWAILVNAQIDAQTFDRDPESYLYERGYNHPNSQEVDYMHSVLQDVVSASIDSVYRNTRAA